MDKITTLKNRILDAYSHLIHRSQLGYPFEGYVVIKEAMLAINFIENNDLDDYKVTTILDHYLRLLSEI